ncbi:MAG: zinc ribbon domain-containing protein [Tannerella sp.]|jgi:hypothetical protein|nr:zinc ribbon domain-containing protein [Tannerella sp.]
MFCKKCGKQIVDGSKFCEYCGANFKTNDLQSFLAAPLTSLLIGILSIMLSVPILFQSIIVLFSSGREGASGMFLTLCWIIAGWVLLATRRSEYNERKGGAIAASVFYFLSALLGFINAEEYSDLIIYSLIALIFGALFLTFAMKYKKEK